MFVHINEHEQQTIYVPANKSMGSRRQYMSLRARAWAAEDNICPCEQEHGQQTIICPCEQAQVTAFGKNNLKSFKKELPGNGQLFL